MQIGFSKENTRRFLKYAKNLDIIYNNQKIIVLSLVYTGFLNPKKNKGSLISLEQKTIGDYKKIYTFDDYKVYQIDLDYCRKIISEKKEKKLWILNKNQTIRNEAKMWIKYLTLPIWCKQSFNLEKDYYVLPPLKKEFFNNKFI